jgi:hypothetical protein
MIPQTAVYPKGGSIMEPRKIETPVQSRGEGRTSPPRQRERKRRFQVIKLEERIAPGGGHGNGSNFSCNHDLTICHCNTNQCCG